MTDAQFTISIWWSNVSLDQNGCQWRCSLLSRSPRSWWPPIYFLLHEVNSPEYFHQTGIPAHLSFVPSFFHLRHIPKPGSLESVPALPSESPRFSLDPLSSLLAVPGTFALLRQTLWASNHPADFDGLSLSWYKHILVPSSLQILSLLSRYTNSMIKPFGGAP